jgi:hypothetical protein
VEAIIERYQFTPNPIARRLKRNRAYHFCALIARSEQDSGYWAQALTGIQEGAGEIAPLGVETEVCAFDRYNPDDFCRVTEAVLDRQLDGIVLSPIMPQRAKSFIMEIQRRKIPYVFFDANLGDNIDAAILGIEGVDYHFQNQTGNPNLTKRITAYDNLSESIKTVVEYNNEGYPERIITDNLIYIIDGYADNNCTVSLLDKNGTYYSFDNISVPQFLVDMPKDVLISSIGTFLDHIALIANSKLMTLVETMNGVTMPEQTRDELKAVYLTFKLIKDGFKTTRNCSAAFASIAAIPATASASLVAAVPLSILCVWNVYITLSSLE